MNQKLAYRSHPRGSGRLGRTAALLVLLSPGYGDDCSMVTLIVPVYTGDFGAKRNSWPSGDKAIANFSFPVWRAVISQPHLVTRFEESSCTLSRCGEITNFSRSSE